MDGQAIFDISFQIICSSGEARSMAMEAISLAKEGKIEEARQMLTDARTEINKAHKHQTNLITSEANGEKNEVSVLLIHSQDHLMNGMTVLDMAGEFIDLYERMSGKYFIVLEGDDYWLYPGKLLEEYDFLEKNKDYLAVAHNTVVVGRDNEEIIFTSLEYKILLMLFTNQNKLITREQLLDKIWDIAGNFVNDNTLTVYIKRIREKLEDETIIKTVRGLGYRIGD